ncbi:hypothetical protein BCR33DRAFT_717205 [Rhizoclosmatium globosum]|uniref:Uncharacterized protein n=1 Tax=Rhizoclosmatium globosum TaxID=329046 RepID=A0A1Y2CAQ6_9FUNG|nr:hypothetical protein BCR33DRAFT_717205 [Rhizoclosmatium globosum]|eukprot:ORY44119.1 hypothetical protein BCR33DRAFT_717205 [Rhizoclosmatium globosum]
MIEILYSAFFDTCIPASLTLIMIITLSFFWPQQQSLTDTIFVPFMVEWGLDAQKLTDAMALACGS